MVRIRKKTARKGEDCVLAKATKGYRSSHETIGVNNDE
jgi:hypothetical protein